MHRISMVASSGIMSSYLNCITLSTGHCLRTPRSEVHDETLALLVPWLNRAVETGNVEPLPVPALSHFGARAIKDIGLVVTIYGPLGPHMTGHPHSGKWLPLSTLGIAQRSRESADLWVSMLAHFGGKPGITAPGAPWAAVAIHATLGGYPDALQWLTDFERCLAWAWISRHRAAAPNRCRRCGYPDGDDWLDGGETCPHCRLVQ